MSDHKFTVGQTVHYQSRPYGNPQRGDVFKIMQRLPPQGDGYHIASRALANHTTASPKKVKLSGNVI